MFHILALILFTPSLVQAHSSRKFLRFIIFAFNSITAILVMIEQARFYLKIKALDNYFMFFADSRETKKGSLIVTHIYLLIGCALPPTMSFILFDGGLFTNEFTTIGLSGVVFLGIGDVAAAIFGQRYGKSLWTDYSGKTIEGSGICYLTMLIAFYFVTKEISPISNHYFVCYLAASWVATAFEAFTRQYDNLICTVVQFITLVQVID
jgi:dolichol kinase